MNSKKMTINQKSFIINETVVNFVIILHDLSVSDCTNGQQ